MFGRMGASYGSRAETLTILESLLELGQKASNIPVEEILEMRLADQLELQARDILALNNLVNNGEYPLCSKSIACEASKGSANLLIHPNLITLSSSD